MAYLSGYSKYKVLTLTGGASGAQTDFQLKLDITYDADMQIDFDDLRFTQSDGTTLIDAWLETKINSDSAEVWAEFPTTPANTVDQIYRMYYGNAGASSDWDFDNTFIAGDPFDNATLDTGRWTSVDGGPTYSIDASNHYLEITNMDGNNWQTGKGFHSKTLSLPTEWVIEDAYSGDGFGMYHDSAANAEIFSSIFSLHHAVVSAADYGIGFFHIGDYCGDSKNLRLRAGVGGNEDYTPADASPALPITYDIKMWKTAGNIHITQDTVERVNEANSETPDRIHLGIDHYETRGFGTKRFYAFKVRKYAANPPTYAFGAEQSVPAGHPTMRRWGGIPGMQYTGRRSW